MKHARLSYYEEFPASPISGWDGAQFFGWVNSKTQNGQWRKPSVARTPFVNQRKLWCLLEVHFQKIDLIFATPNELDHFIDVMSKNPLPSGPALISGQERGRPNNHWLSRLPKAAKPWKFRQAICKFLSNCNEVAEFRKFYEENSIQLEFEGYHKNYWDAVSAQKTEAS